MSILISFTFLFQFQVTASDSKPFDFRKSLKIAEARAGIVSKAIVSGDVVDMETVFKDLGREQKALAYMRLFRGLRFRAIRMDDAGEVLIPEIERARRLAIADPIYAKLIGDEIERSTSNLGSTNERQSLFNGYLALLPSDAAIFTTGLFLGDTRNPDARLPPLIGVASASNELLAARALRLMPGGPDPEYTLARSELIDYCKIWFEDWQSAHPDLASLAVRSGDANRKREVERGPAPSSPISGSSHSGGWAYFALLVCIMIAGVFACWHIFSRR